MYDAWGKVIAVKDANGSTITNPNHLANLNPFRYRGYFYDVESNLYYLKSRYYNSEWGRFINIDEPTLLGASGTLFSFNIFTYCENNPIMFIDPNGYFGFNPDGSYDGSINLSITLSHKEVKKIILAQTISGILIDTILTLVVYYIPATAPYIVPIGAAITAAFAVTIALFDYFDDGDGIKITMNIRYGSFTTYIPVWQLIKSKYYGSYYGYVYKEIVIRYGYINKFQVITL